MRSKTLNKFSLFLYPQCVCFQNKGKVTHITKNPFSQKYIVFSSTLHTKSWGTVISSEILKSWEVLEKTALSLSQSQSKHKIWEGLLLSMNSHADFQRVLNPVDKILQDVFPNPSRPYSETTDNQQRMCFSNLLKSLCAGFAGVT